MTHYSPKEKRRLRTLYNHGLPIKEIAERLERSDCGIRCIISREIKAGRLDKRNICRGRQSRPAYGRLNRQKVLAIRLSHKRGVPQKELANIYGVCQQTISDVVNNKTWRQ